MYESWPVIIAHLTENKTLLMLLDVVSVIGKMLREQNQSIIFSICRCFVLCYDVFSFMMLY